MNTISNPLDISNYARSRQIELIMALHGRSTANPRQYRDWLMGLSEAELQAVYEQEVEAL